MAPCTILHWRSPVRLSMGGLYKDHQKPFREQSGSKISVHLNASIPAKERECDTLTQV
uniref:Uncharacterized protein n=1 Tax=Anguilla anguilla TaxID=7936 RepID=A0A0E9W450_ANGAN